jgi:hypothetical protein
MNIPQRLWRVFRGRIALARQDGDESYSLADATAELERSLEAARLAAAEAAAAPETRPLPPSAPRDPLEQHYQVLKLEPGSDLAALDWALQARLAELHPERYPVGSPERLAEEGRKRAIEDAYEALRDALNVTETRFEKLEFDK